MIDLTPLDVRKKRGDFRRILRGFDPEEVNTFLDLVAERLEELVRQNLSLSERTERLESQLAALEGREKAVQEALVTAQKLREDVKHQSARDAEILREQASQAAGILKAQAETEINRRLGEAEGRILERKRALEELERSRLKFLKTFRGLLERELDAVEVEESRRPLEDTPFDLDLRGWMPGRQDEEEPHPEEPEESEAAAAVAGGGEEVPEAGEPSKAEKPAPDGFRTQVLEIATPGEEAVEGLEGAEETAPAGMKGEEEPVIVDVESLIMDVGAVMPTLNEAEQEGGEAGEEEEPAEAFLPKDPKWLFTLLKKEKEDEEGRE